MLSIRFPCFTKGNIIHCLGFFCFFYLYGLDLGLIYLVFVTFSVHIPATLKSRKSEKGDRGGCGGPRPRPGSRSLEHDLACPPPRSRRTGLGDSISSPRGVSRTGYFSEFPPDSSPNGTRCLLTGGAPSPVLQDGQDQLPV